MKSFSSGEQEGGLTAKRFFFFSLFFCSRLAKECEPLFSRTNISTVDTTNPGAAPHKGRKRLITNDILESVPIIEELTINEIFNGSPKKGFPGKYLF